MNRPASCKNSERCKGCHPFKKCTFLLEWFTQYLTSSRIDIYFQGFAAGIRSFHQYKLLASTAHIRIAGKGMFQCRDGLGQGKLVKVISFVRSKYLSLIGSKASTMPVTAARVIKRKEDTASAKWLYLHIEIVM
jgi:hypothetical protein